LGQAVAQQPEVVAVQFGRVGLLQLVRMDRGNHGFTVVLVQAGPGGGGEVPLRAFGNAGPGFRMPAQRAG